MLSQMAEDGSDQPVGYFSRKLLTREDKYSTIEECLAIKLAVQAFRVYLLGRPFIIQTDHRALEWLDRVKENNGRLTRGASSCNPTSSQCSTGRGRGTQMPTRYRDSSEGAATWKLQEKGGGVW